MPLRDDTPLFLAAVSIGELRRGVELIRHRGAHPQAQLDGDAAQIWGRLRVPDPQNAINKQIAAIALLHHLTMVTRNTDDFAGCGVRLLNPFQAP
jgi:predicted nucleic acid-binding protein